MRSILHGCGLLGLTLVSSVGCALCDVGDLCSYSAVGGKWQRSDPSCGRVGSVFSDAGAYPVSPGETVLPGKSVAGLSRAPAIEETSTVDSYYDGAYMPSESIPSDAASFPENVIIIGDEDFSE